MPLIVSSPFVLIFFDFSFRFSSPNILFFGGESILLFSNLVLLSLLLFIIFELYSTFILIFACFLCLFIFLSLWILLSFILLLLSFFSSLIISGDEFIVLIQFLSLENPLIKKTINYKYN